MTAEMKYKLVAGSDEESREPLFVALFTKVVLPLTDWGISRRYRKDKTTSQVQAI